MVGTHFQRDSDEHDRNQSEEGSRILDEVEQADPDREPKQERNRDRAGADRDVGDEPKRQRNTADLGK
jgi:hypothetical protein